MIDYPTVERALRSADPEALPEAVRDALLAMGVDGVEVYLADYGLRVLSPVGVAGAAGTVPIHASVEGKAFATQQPQYQRHGDGTTSVTVPVTVRGDRHGTLTACLPADDTAGDGTDARGGSAGTADGAGGADAGAADAARSLRTEVETLQAVARLLGHEIVVAERDTDRYQLARRAAGSRWPPRPSGSCCPAAPAGDASTLWARQLEPAYAIRGDSYDWAATATDLTLTVVNGMGEGTAAALLTSLTVNALRNARRAGLDLADQAALADQALYAQHRGRSVRQRSAVVLRVRLRAGDRRGRRVAADLAAARTLGRADHCGAADAAGDVRGDRLHGADVPGAARRPAGHHQRWRLCRAFAGW